MSSQPEPLTSVRHTTGAARLTRHLQTQVQPGNAARSNLFDVPADPHYDEMRYGPAAWDAAGYDDEERPRE